jgi:hypothetical protein
MHNIVGEAEIIARHQKARDLAPAVRQGHRQAQHAGGQRVDVRPPVSLVGKDLIGGKRARDHDFFQRPDFAVFKRGADRHAANIAVEASPARCAKGSAEEVVGSGHDPKQLWTGL